MSEPTPVIPQSTVEYYAPMPVLLAPRRRQRYWLHAVLLLATFFTTLVVGSHFQYNFEQQRPALADEEDSYVPLFPIDVIWHHPSRLLLGIPFSASLMLILLAHEMGHYLACLRYNVDATLPFFIPFPSLIGTMGAFIRIRSPIHSRRALFDIGIAGPIAGFVVACLVLAIALVFSRVAPVMPAPTEAYSADSLPADFWFGAARARIVGNAARHHGIAAGYSAAPSHGFCCVGRDVCDLAQPAARRPVGWRPHRVFNRTATAPYDFAAYHPVLDSDGGVSVGGMADLGDPARDQQLPPPASRRISESVGQAPRAGRFRFVDAGSDVDSETSHHHRRRPRSDFAKGADP